MSVPFTSPNVQLDAFNCPHCGAYANQNWGNMFTDELNEITSILNFQIGSCVHCEKITIWEEQKMIYPSTGNAPMPNSDMPDEIKDDYNEARNIVSDSPRAACALLRLCIEKICNDKIKGKDLNDKIKKLAKQGLDDNIIKALDSVRIIGNQAVHPLEMDLKDNEKIATGLFEIVNYISQWAYTQKKNIDVIFKSLPKRNKKAIKKRGS